MNEEYELVKTDQTTSDGLVGEGPANIKDFTIFPNTQYTNQNNVIYFRNERDLKAFFTAPAMGGYKFKTYFNISRDKCQIKIPGNINNFAGYNYGYYRDELDRFNFFYINEFESLNSETTLMYITPDPLQTISYGGTLSDTVGSCFVEREHPETRTDLIENLQYYTSNNDTLTSGSNVYNKKSWFKPLKSDLMVFTTTVDLSADFGNADDPKLSSSKGQTLDGIISPQNIYICEKSDYTIMLEALSDYPWITRCITSNMLIPNEIVGGEAYGEKVKNKNVDIRNIYTVNPNYINKRIKLMEISWNDFREELGLSITKSDDYMLRYPYTYLELRNNSGQSISLKFEDFKHKGNNGEFFNIDANSVFGYANVLSIYARSHLCDYTNSVNDTVPEGSFLANSITYNNFNSIATLTDTYKTKLADTAHQRKLSQDKLLTNRVKDIFSGDNLQNKFMNALSIAGSFSPSGILSGLTNEWEYYRSFNAELADSKISSPSLTTQDNTNSFAIATETMGVQLLLKKVNDRVFENAKQYHAVYGFEVKQYKFLNDFNNKIFNYVKCSIDGLSNPYYVLPQHIPLLQTRLQAGVKFWNGENVQPGRTFTIYGDDLKDNMSGKRWDK